MVEDVAAITGLSVLESATFLEMAGGSLEAAVALYFDLGAVRAGAAQRCRGTTKKGRPCNGNAISSSMPYCKDHQSQ